MTNEAVIIELGDGAGNPIRFTCASDSTFTKGALLGIVEPRTVSGGNVIGYGFAGIAAMDKDSEDSSTSISCYTTGIFDILCGDALAAGTYVALSGNNIVRAVSEAYISGGAIVGKALETANAGEVIAVKLGL